MTIEAANRPTASTTRCGRNVYRPAGEALNLFSALSHEAVIHPLNRRSITFSLSQASTLTRAQNAGLPLHEIAHMARQIPITWANAMHTTRIVFVNQ
ncbi:MAG: hypothetical protein QM581_15635 [Pseudomonas sp.]